jgi:hypothetical protein
MFAKLPTSPNGKPHCPEISCRKTRLFDYTFKMSWGQKHRDLFAEGLLWVRWIMDRPFDP